MLKAVILTAISCMSVCPTSLFVHRSLEVFGREDPPGVAGAEDDAVGGLEEGEPVVDGAPEVYVDSDVAVASHP